jgi:hypothetical protein
MLLASIGFRWREHTSAQDFRQTIFAEPKRARTLPRLLLRAAGLVVSGKIRINLNES